jgi:hypothetical protein
MKLKLNIWRRQYISGVWIERAGRGRFMDFKSTYYSVWDHKSRLTDDFVHENAPRGIYEA